MARHGIPTARYRVCDDARRTRTRSLARGELGFPVVVKADGLAAGKGVVVAPDRDSGRRRGSRGDGGAAVRRRRRAASCSKNASIGPEVSFFAMCDGARAIPLSLGAGSQAHLRRRSQGPNTGGMGAFCAEPAGRRGDAGAGHARDRRAGRCEGLRPRGIEYRGFLYAGLMLTCDGPKVIEFNVRFGDPEAQVVLPAIDGALAPHLVAAAAGRLDATPIAFSRDKLVGVVLASRGLSRVRARRVCRSTVSTRPTRSSDVTVFHCGHGASGTARVVTAGGRVLTVVGRGDTFEAAIARAYEGVARIEFDGMQYRRDIGAKARGLEGAGDSQARAARRHNCAMTQTTVLILMGSDSDAPVMQAAVDTLHDARHHVRDDRRLRAPLAGAGDAPGAGSARARRQGVHRRRRRRRAPRRRRRGAYHRCRSSACRSTRRR